MSDSGKKSGKLREGYIIAKDPAEWEAEQAKRAAEEPEDDDEEEDVDMLAEDGEQKVTAGQKRKRAAAADKAKKDTKAKSDGAAAKKRKVRCDATGLYTAQQLIMSSRLRTSRIKRQTQRSPRLPLPRQRTKSPLLHLLGKVRYSIASETNSDRTMRRLRGRKDSQRLACNAAEGVLDQGCARSERKATLAVWLRFRLIMMMLRRKWEISTSCSRIWRASRCSQSGLQ